MEYIDLRKVGRECLKEIRRQVVRLKKMDKTGKEIEYTTEQKEILEQFPAMETRLQELKDSSSNIIWFIENAKRYSEIPELTSEILRIFIRRIEVGERAEKYSRTAAQEIRIYYRDVGLVDELPRSITDAMTQEIHGEVA